MQFTEDQKKLVQTFYDKLKLDGAIIKLTPQGTLYVNEEKVTLKNALTFLQAQCKGRSDLSPILLMEMNHFITLMKLTIANSMRHRPEYDQVEVRNYNYEGLIPFQSVTDASRFVLFDATTSTVTDLDFATFKANRDTARIEPIRGRIEFNPYSPKPIDFRPDIFGRPCNYLNTYKKPSWQFARELAPGEVSAFAPPQIFKEFMVHLFPDLECRRYVLDWLHFALTDRCETYLVLNGAKGIGKNLFSENFCKPLMGSHNHKIAQPSALESNFNALLKDTRMIVFDEFRVDTPEKVNKLKRYVNEEQMIENKGKDVGETVKTYNSFIISNNDMSDMKIAWDDRRFSVMDLTKIKLLDAWDSAKIDELLECFKDTEAMRNIGYWLMYRKPTYNKFKAYQKRHFYDLCYSSFSEWQKCLIDIAMSKSVHEITNADLKKEYRKRTETTRIPNFNKVKDFVQNYRHEGEFSIGEIFKTSPENWTIELADAFRAEENETETEVTL